MFEIVLESWYIESGLLKELRHEDFAVLGQICAKNRYLLPLPIHKMLL